MSDATFEQAYLEDALSRLSDYLLQDELFWSVNAGGFANAPRLTLGNVLLYAKRLAVKDPAAAADVRAKLAAIQTEWQTHWAAKAKQEYSSRLRQWANYIEELRADLPAHSAYYSTEVQVRALLALLADELGGALPDGAELLAALDSALWSYLEEGAFLWDEELMAAFPKEDYWFLYGALRE